MIDISNAPMPNAHKCPNGDRIRPYAALLCSMCKPGQGIDLVLTEAELERVRSKGAPPKPAGEPTEDI